MSNKAKVPTVKAIGSAFVNQYYHMLVTDPENLHKMYSSYSLFSHNNEDDDHAEVIQGFSNIEKQLARHDMREQKVRFSMIESQKSLNNSILVMVTGSIENKVGGFREFCQSFVLAPQENGYFILNDIFRYLKYHSNHNRETEKHNKNNNNNNNSNFSMSSSEGHATSETRGSLQRETEIQSTGNIQQQNQVYHCNNNNNNNMQQQSLHQLANNIGDQQLLQSNSGMRTSIAVGPTDPLRGVGQLHNNVKSINESGAMSNTIRNHKVEGDPEHNMVRLGVLSGSTASSIDVLRSPSPMLPVVSSTTDEAQGSNKQLQQQTLPEKDHKKLNTYGGRAYQYALFISAVTNESSDEQIIKAFEKFGNIIDVTNKSKEKQFAFVYFDLPDGVEEAMKFVQAGGTITINGQTVQVERRKPQYNNNNNNNTNWNYSSSEPGNSTSIVNNNTLKKQNSGSLLKRSK